MISKNDNNTSKFRLFTQKSGFAKYLINNFILLLTLTLLIIGIKTDSFYTVYNINALLISISTIGFLAIGEMYVMMFGEIDLSIGYLMIFSSFAAVKLMELTGNIVGFEVYSRGTVFGGSQLILAILTILLPMVVGLIIGLAVVYLKVKSFIMTLGMMSILFGFNYVFSGGRSIFLSESKNYLLLGSIKFFKVIPLMFFLLLIIVAAMVILIRFNLVGKRVVAVGADRKIAALAGINSKIYVITSFVTSGFFAGLGGLFFTARSTIIDPKRGATLAITAIAIAVLGGTTLKGGEVSPFRVLLSAVFLGTMLNIFILNGFSGWLQTLVVGVFVIIGFSLNNLKELLV